MEERQKQERKWCIYKHTNKINGKVYIGQTCQNPKNRWRKGNGYKGSSYFWNAIQKYGWDNFEHEILYDELTLEDANKVEENTISLYESNNPDKGYNLKSGGENNLYSDESKRKISETRKKNNYNGENNPFFGKHHSEETKEILREKACQKTGKDAAFYGHHHTEKAKAKISEAQKQLPARHGEEAPFYGHHHTEETKEQISAKLLGENNPNYGKPMSDYVKMKLAEGRKKLVKENHPMYGKHQSEESRKKTSKPVKCIETNTVYYGVAEASRQTNVNINSIVACCKGRQHTAGGCHWEYYKGE